MPFHQRTAKTYLLSDYLKQTTRQTNTDEKGKVHNTLVTKSMGKKRGSPGREWKEIFALLCRET
jgi:hypothetical protein